MISSSRQQGCLVVRKILSLFISYFCGSLVFVCVYLPIDKLPMFRYGSIFIKKSPAIKILILSFYCTNTGTGWPEDYVACL